MASFLDREPDSRKEKAINIAKSHGFNIRPIDINTSGAGWQAVGRNTLVAPLNSIKGLGDKAIEEIIAHRPFKTVEEMLFHPDIVYRKFNKKSLDALCRAGALTSLIDDRFTGDRHFWMACCMDRPKSLKKLREHIEAYKAEGEFCLDDKIKFLTELTGTFPLSMVAGKDRLEELEKECTPPISEYDHDLKKCWAIPLNVNARKTKKGKWFFVVDVIDSNSVITKIRCWGVQSNDVKSQVEYYKDPDNSMYPEPTIWLNRLYKITPKYNDNWGFSTFGKIDSLWTLLE